jgi:hypothetical protein
MENRMGKESLSQPKERKLKVFGSREKDKVYKIQTKNDKNKIFVNFIYINFIKNNRFFIFY